MKRIVLGCIFVLSCININAQVTKDSLLNKMVKEACDEIKKKDFSAVTKDNLETELGLALVPVFIKNLDQIQKVYGTDKSSKQDAMRKVGEDIGIRLVLECPEFMAKMIDAKDENDEPTENAAGSATRDYDAPIAARAPRQQTASTNNQSAVYTEATLTSINQGDITIINITNEDGTKDKLYWLEYFENANSFQKNQAKYIGKKIKYSYEEKLLYNAAKKDYIATKVITSISLVN